MKKTAAIQTLDSLYSRATRAFLNRNVADTRALLDSAISLIHPPTDLPDALDSQRKRWDILRITVETTVHLPSPKQMTETLPESIKDILLQTPHALINTMYTRSLQFFTPQSTYGKSPTAASVSYLPSQVLLTLVYSSLKLECAEVGRSMIEDWLAARQVSASGDDAYEKILELYCLQVLPGLGQWDYAVEFLDYELELPVTSREHIKSALQSLKTAAFAPARPPPSLQAPSPSSIRSFSPTPSASSSSSSLSTTSTHTIVPATPRGNRPPDAAAPLSPLASSPQSSTSSIETARRPTATPGDRTPSQRKVSPPSTTPPGHPLSLPRSHSQAPVARPSNPSTLALIRAALAPHFSTGHLTTFIIIAFIVPTISFIIRLRRRRANVMVPQTAAVANTAELVRRRLLNANGRDASVWGRVWSEAVKIVVDTVRMGGSGLV